MSLAHNPYQCAQEGVRYLLHVSGGRTSGLLLYHVLDAYGGRLPPNVRAVFANTGKEHEKTLLFVREMERRWHVPIAWVEYVYRKEARGGMSDPKNTFRVVGYGTASRRGEPFEMLIRAHRMLPNAHRRMCTADLKVETAARFARVKLGWWRPRPHSILGIRYDEPARWAKAIWEQCRTVYPLVLDRVTEDDVKRFWAAQPFDLGISHDLGNCDLCFMKGRWKLMRLEGPVEADAAHHPVPRAGRLVDRAGAVPSVGCPKRPQARADALPDALHLRGPARDADDALRRARAGPRRERERVVLLRRLTSLETDSMAEHHRPRAPHARTAPADPRLPMTWFQPSPRPPFHAARGRPPRAEASRSRAAAATRSAAS